MVKKDRVALFHHLMKNQLPASTPQEAWNLMSSILDKIEQENAPVSEKHMTILPLDNKDVQPYGQGGYAIPLIGYTIFINSNGAIGIIDAWNCGIYSIKLEGSDGNCFAIVPQWKYQLPK